MSKITNNGLTRSGTGCFIAVPVWQQWASKGTMNEMTFKFIYDDTVQQFSIKATHLDQQQNSSS